MADDQELKKLYSLNINPGGIVILRLLGVTATLEDNLRLTEILEEEFFNLFKKKGFENKKLNFLADIRGMEKKMYTGFKAAKNLMKMLSDERLGKMAICYTKKSAAKTAAEYMIKSVGKNDVIQWFTDENKAMEWLRK